MSDVIVLRNTSVDLLSDVGRQFITDATRAGEGLISDKELAEIYDLSPADWQNITKDMALARAIRAERDRRLRNGTAVQEAAAKHHFAAPGILKSIMTDAGASPKSKIEAIKELRVTAAGSSSSDSPTGAGPFVIHIDMGDGHVVHREFNNDSTSSGDSPTNLIPWEGKSDGTE